MCNEQATRKLTCHDVKVERVSTMQDDGSQHIKRPTANAMIHHRRLIFYVLRNYPSTWNGRDMTHSMGLRLFKDAAAFSPLLLFSTCPVLTRLTEWNIPTLWYSANDAVNLCNDFAMFASCCYNGCRSTFMQKYTWIVKRREQQKRKTSKFATFEWRHTKTQLLFFSYFVAFCLRAARWNGGMKADFFHLISFWSSSCYRCVCVCMSFIVIVERTMKLC